MSVPEKLKNGETVVLSSFTKDGTEFSLHIEQHEAPDGFEFKEEHHLITRYFEIGSSEVHFEYDLNYNINNVDGKIFRVPSQDDADVIPLRFISLLTDRDKDGNVSIPDEPYSEGEFDCPPGVYRVWDTTHD